MGIFYRGYSLVFKVILQRGRLMVRFLFFVIVFFNFFGFQDFRGIQSVQVVQDCVVGQVFWGGFQELIGRSLGFFLEGLLSFVCLFLLGIYGNWQEWVLWLCDLKQLRIFFFYLLNEGWDRLFFVRSVGNSVRC